VKIYRYFKVCAVAFLFLTLVVLISEGIRFATLNFIHPDTNWQDYRSPDWSVYLTAAHQLIQGNNPYQLPGQYQFYNPPWMLLLYLPFLAIPYPFNLALFISIALAVYLYVYTRYNDNLLSAGLFLISAPVFVGLFMGQLDWVVLLGLLLPPQYGLFLILAKPQIGCVVAIVWLIDAYQKQRVVRTFLPVAVGFVLSFLVFGLWPLNWFHLTQVEPLWSWPYVLILGIPLLIFALKHQSVQLALCAGPALSPHTLLHSWSGAMLWIGHPATMALFSLGTWVIRIYGSLHKVGT